MQRFLTIHLILLFCAQTEDMNHNMSFLLNRGIHELLKVRSLFTSISQQKGRQKPHLYLVAEH